MAGSKQQTRVATASRSRSSTSASPSTTAVRTQRPKPSVEYVDVASDDKEAGPTRGVLAGLDPNSILTSIQRNAKILQDGAGGDVEPSEGDNSIDPPEPTHVTRGSRYGRAAVNYDQKYHPMDATLRPRHAAKRLSGVAHLPHQVFEEGDDLTSEDELSLGSEPESSDDEETIVPRRQPKPKPRMPDPGATRHSSRAEARKTVNYNTKVHPQDNALPFRRHNAELDEEPPIKPKQPDKRGLFEKRSSLASRDTGKAPSRPHKKLRIHESSPRIHAKPTMSRRKASRPSTPAATSTDVEELATRAIQGSQAQPIALFDEDDNDEDVEQGEDDHEQYDEAALDRRLAQEMEEIHHNLEMEAPKYPQGSDFADHMAVTDARSFDEEVASAHSPAKPAARYNAISHSTSTGNGIPSSKTFVSHSTAEGRAQPVTEGQAEDLPSTAPPSPQDRTAESSFVPERLAEYRAMVRHAANREIANTSSPAPDQASDPTSALDQSEGPSGEDECTTTT